MSLLDDVNDARVVKDLGWGPLGICIHANGHADLANRFANPRFELHSHPSGGTGELALLRVTCKDRQMTSRYAVETENCSRENDDRIECALRDLDKE